MMPELEGAAMHALRVALESDPDLSRGGYQVVECEHGILIERQGHALGLVQHGAGDFVFLLTGYGIDPVFREQRVESIVERIVGLVRNLTDNKR